MNFSRNFALAALAITLFTASARAEDVKAGDLVISQAWSRATPSGAKIAGGYLTIENKGTARTGWSAAAADIAGRVEMHEMAMDNGVMKMRPLDKGLAIEPGKTVKFAPGGYHLMLMDLKQPAEAGRQGAGDARIRKGGQGDCFARCARRRRARTRGRRAWWPHGDEEVA